MPVTDRGREYPCPLTTAQRESERAGEGARAVTGNTATGGMIGHEEKHRADNTNQALTQIVARAHSERVVARAGGRGLSVVMEAYLDVRGGGGEDEGGWCGGALCVEFERSSAADRRLRHRAEEGERHTFSGPVRMRRGSRLRRSAILHSNTIGGSFASSKGRKRYAARPPPLCA